MEYKSNHHVVWCPKYRHKVLVNGVDVRLKELIEKICVEYQIDIIEMEIMPDRYNMLKCYITKETLCNIHGTILNSTAPGHIEKTTH